MTTEAIDLTDRNDIVLDGRLICVVDDDELYRAHIAALLEQKNLRVVEAAGTTELHDILDRGMPDCILLDYNLLSENGLFIVDRLKQRYSALAPVVMVSADETQRTTIRAFRAGVADYVSKRGLRQEELVSAVRRAIGLRIREGGRERELERLRHNARFDEQTGLLMRAALDERLPLVLGTARRLGRPCALVGFRIVHLLEVQDRFGVVAADRVLRIFGQKLRDLIRSTDLCGVWDRGTFAFVIDSDASPRALSTFIRRVSDNLAIEVDLAAAHLGLSTVAASALGPDEADTPEELCALLDERLAEATRVFGENATASTDWIRQPEEMSASPETGAPERRHQPRMRTLKQGRIYLNNLQSTIDCTVRNLSSAGAGLRLMGPTAIPEFFRLKISDSGAIRRVRKCWHLNNDLGVEFLSD